jgi:hypothetical protein
MRHWHRRRGNDIEAALRAEAPSARDELVSAIADRIAERSRARTRPMLRVAGVLAITSALTAAFGAFGGLGYAATAVAGVAEAVAGGSGGSAPAARVAPRTSADDQYKEERKQCLAALKEENKDYHAEMKGDHKAFHRVKRTSAAHKAFHAEQHTEHAGFHKADKAARKECQQIGR